MTETGEAAARPNEEFVRFTTRAGDALTREFAAFRGSPEFSPDDVLPGTEAILMRRSGVAVARISLFVVEGLVGTTGTTGLIGHYEAVDADAGRRVLAHATEVLAREGVTRVLGPMNGSTWMRYRLALPPAPDEAGNPSAWFAGEPSNPAEYASHWLAAGFEIAELYETACESIGIVAAAAHDGLPGADTTGGRTSATGSSAAGTATAATPAGEGATCRIRPLALGRFDEELASLHRVSLAAFAENAFYSPISFDAFRALYAPFAGRLDPAFVLLAEHAVGEPIGFVFAYPDPLLLLDGAPTRLVVKTLAVTPAARGLRVASALLDGVRAEAIRRGYREILSALMRADNASVGMAARRRGTRLRSYALYGRNL